MSGRTLHVLNRVLIVTGYLTQQRSLEIRRISFECLHLSQERPTLALHALVKIFESLEHNEI